MEGTLKKNGMPIAKVYDIEDKGYENPQGTLPVGEIGLTPKEVEGKGALTTGKIELTPEVVADHFPEGGKPDEIASFLDGEKPMDLVIGGTTYKDCSVRPHFENGKITSAEIKYSDRDSGQNA